MQKAICHYHDNNAKHSVKSRVEKDIAAINRKLVLLEQQPHPSDQLLAAYRTMLKTRTEVLECLEGTSIN